MKRYSGPGTTETKSDGPAKLPLASPAVLFLLTMAVMVLGVVGWLWLTQPGSKPATGTAAIGGPFVLTDQNNKRVTEAVLKGRWSAVFFGYVSCPDICPATLQTLGTAQTRLGPDGDRLQAVFISVDPARDTPAQLKAWLDQPGFPKKVVALTGSSVEIAAVAQAYRVYYAKENKAKDYQVAHSAAIYLMDPNGQFSVPLTYEQGPAKLADDIRKAMHGG
jgi:protein SCO1/2